MSALLKDPALGLLFLCGFLSLVHFVSGSFRAWLNGVFELSALKAWVAKDGAQLIPILIYVVAAKVVSLIDLVSIAKAYGIDISEAGGLSGLGSLALSAYGGLQAATFILSTLKDIQLNLKPDPEAWKAKVAKAVRIGDPIPGTTPKVE